MASDRDLLVRFVTEVKKLKSGTHVYLARIQTYGSEIGVFDDKCINFSFLENRDPNCLEKGHVVILKANSNHHDYWIQPLGKYSTPNSTAQLI